MSKLERYALPLEGKRVVLLYSDTLSKEEYEHLIEWLELLKPGLIAAQQAGAADSPKAVAQIEVDGKMVEVFDSGEPHVVGGG